MNELRFLFAVHNHQPVGNFPGIVGKAFRKCYGPLLERIARHPSFQFALHFSGPLWEYMETRERTIWGLIEGLAARGQIELLSGGFYEPVLSLIPEKDRIGQIRMMNRFLREKFNQRPRGLWLTERVWEPHLPSSLARAGIAYTLLDEEHFRYAGVRNIGAAYITENEGQPLYVFPINKDLRYLIPFRPLKEVDRFFDTIRANGGTAILGDDGEKFGVWPGTGKTLRENGWLESFLVYLENNGIRAMTFSSYLDNTVPAGRIYLPPASYEEMMEWTLEPHASDLFRKFKAKTRPELRRFLRGGNFRDFFLKYHEANHLHKRMILVSKEVHASSKKDALRNLYKGQCNDAYWHGIFGGLYLPHLREAAYRHLLQAEKSTAAEQGWKKLDYDLDGKTEFFWRGKTFNILVKPNYGGSIVELDDVPLARNLSNVLTRTRESYHARENRTGRADQKAVGKSIHVMEKAFPRGAEDLVHSDGHLRLSLLDRFLPDKIKKRAYLNKDVGEEGNFFTRPYRARLQNDNASLVLEREGWVHQGPLRIPVRIRKTIRAVGRSLAIVYDIWNLSPKTQTLRFGCEWNILAFPHEIERKKGIRGIDLFEKRLLFRARAADGFWIVPLRTLSQSERGFDIIHQGYCLFPWWKLILPGKSRKRLHMSWNKK